MDSNIILVSILRFCALFLSSSALCIFSRLFFKNHIAFYKTHAHDKKPISKTSLIDI